MKMTCTAIIKRVKELEERKNALTENECAQCTVSFVTDKDKVDTGYVYETVQKQIDDLDDEIRRLKGILNYANATVKVADTGFTIGEALVRLAQLSVKRARLDELPKVQSSRRVTYNGVIERTECLFDTEKVKADMERVREEIAALQMAIDKTNLTHEAEV